MSIDLLKDSTPIPNSTESYIEQANQKIMATLKFLLREEDSETIKAKLPEFLMVFVSSIDDPDKAMRIPYKQITVFVNSRLSSMPEDADRITQNLKRFCDDAENGCRRQAAKILDHIDLALTQSQCLKNETEKVTKSVEEASEKIEDLRQNLFSQIMGVVAIFTGIAFILFGGVSALSGLQEAVSSTTSGFLRSISFVSIVAIGIIGAIYLFFRFVMAITNKTYGTDTSLIKLVKNLLIWLVIIALIALALSVFAERSEFSHDIIETSKSVAGKSLTWIQSEAALCTVWVHDWLRLEENEAYQTETGDQIIS
ncbi:MAG: hypothetical protein RBR15_15635 [Sphaerochaeta sp.]|nr:hypothetical protein [Sphaerochaeta sp.]